MVSTSDTKTSLAKRFRLFARRESTIPKEAVLCICHNHVLYQFSRETLKHYRARIEDCSSAATCSGSRLKEGAWN